MIRAVFRWLSDIQNPQWLLIFDNYDDPSLYIIWDYVPSTTNGSVLITTRVPDLLRGQRTQQVRVPPVDDLEESVEILQRRSQRENVKHGKRVQWIRVQLTLLTMRRR